MSEEQLREELEQTKRMKVSGWVLLDFPSTLAQAKAMEEVMTGFVCTVDKPKDESQTTFEKWSKIADPEQKEPAEGQSTKSGLDGMVFFNTSQEECQRRAANRKVDPNTGTVYHMEDNPPPSNDNKLMDRLQEYHDEDEKYLGHEQYEDDLLKRWASQFGQGNVQLQMDIDGDKKRDEAIEEVMGHVQRVIELKQEWHTEKRDQVKEKMKEAQEESQQEEVPKGEEEKEEGKSESAKSK